MQTIPMTQAESNFRNIVTRILEDLEPAIVMTESGDSIVMLSLAEFNAWQETLYLLSTPANANHLRQSIAEDQAGYATDRELLE